MSGERLRSEKQEKFCPAVKARTRAAFAKGDILLVMATIMSRTTEVDGKECLLFNIHDTGFWVFIHVLVNDALGKH